MLKRVDHIEFGVQDLEGTVDFYKSMGFEEVRRTDHHDLSVELKLPGDHVVFEFHKLAMTANPGINHIAFAADDAPSDIAALKARGVTFDREALPVGETGRRVTNFRDPQGLRLQFAEQLG
jgi:glyoxylase I family protein